MRLANAVAFSEAEDTDSLRGKDFRVDYAEDPNGFGVDYFLKYGEKHKDTVVMFAKGFRLQKTYAIGKWFKDENGEKRKKSQMRKEIRACMQENEKTESTAEMQE